MAAATTGGAEDDRSGDGAGYRPVSALAVAAAALGAASTVALVGPLFWLVPIVGAAVSWAALADVGRRDAPKAGRLAALAGVALSLGFGVQAVATTATAEWLARGRAEAAVKFWLDTIATGRLDDARSMCVPDAAAAVDRVAACGKASPTAVRSHGRDETTGGRIVRAAVGGSAFDVELASTPPRRPGEPERYAIARCDAVTPSAK